MIEAQGLTKFFGDFLAINDVNFTVHRGEIVGFLGPNGSGKTTTMRILTGYLSPTSGAAKIAGFDVQTQSLDARKHIGYLPETVPLYTEMTVEDYLAYMGRIRSMDSRRLKRRMDEVIDIVRIGDYRNTHIGKLSKGYRQRVGLAQAVLHEPEVLILDEPTIGIDPIQVVETRHLIRSLGQDHTVILSTHILPEVSAVCQRVLIIHEGEVVAEDTPTNLAERLQGTERIELEVLGPAKEVVSALRAVPGVADVRRQGDGATANHVYLVECRRGADLREQLAKTIVQHGWGLLKLGSVSMSLEEVFLQLTARGEGDK
ncbi:MAG: ATP-binding cassette domain-containing protein [Chloroflexi bacterium]|nr:ATP-binding cassette domain-containing protein [Chloroflexota bacterium]